VLLYQEETLALRAWTELQLARGAGDGGGAALARHLERDGGSALVQAALGLPGRDGRSALPFAAAAARARAIAPRVFEGAPKAFAPLASLPPATSSLEEIGVLPTGSQLAGLAVRDDPLGVALRAAYRVRVGDALLGELARRPLGADEERALGPLLDPALLRRAAEAVAARGGSAEGELRPLWHPGLPALPH
jgi:hypothetical protein